MNNSLISIIVPIYKAQQTIHRCIDSLLAQTYPNFELILIDDGSPDRCGLICDEYAAKDERIVVVHQQNRGVATARQRGIDLLRGAYFIYCDPDDWAEPEMLEQLWKKAQEVEADLVWCDFYSDDEKGTHYVSQDIGSEMNDDFVDALANARIMGVLWNRLINRRLCINAGGVKFDDKLFCCEDLLFVVTLFMRNPQAKIAYHQRAYYHYWQNSNSILHSLNAEKSIYIYQTIVTRLEELLPHTPKDDFYFYKRIVIGGLYQQGRYEEMHRLYREVHARIFREMSFTARFSHFGFCLYGYPRLGRLIERIKTILKNIIHAR